MKRILLSATVLCLLKFSAMAQNVIKPPGGNLHIQGGLIVTNNGTGNSTNILAAITGKQEADADLTTYAGITPSANVQSLLAAANYSAMRTLLTLVPGTDVQAYDADLLTYAGITPSANVQSLLAAANYAAMRTLLTLTVGTDVQAFDADLSTYAGITPSANVQSLLGAANYAAMKTLLDIYAMDQNLRTTDSPTFLAETATRRDSPPWIGTIANGGTLVLDVATNNYKVTATGAGWTIDLPASVPTTNFFGFWIDVTNTVTTIATSDTTLYRNEMTNTVTTITNTGAGNFTMLIRPALDGTLVWRYLDVIDDDFARSATGATFTDTEAIQIACSDELTPISAGTAKVTFRMPFAATLTGVRASLTTAQASGSTFTVDINEAGSTILSTKLTLDNTEKTSTTAAAAAVISDAALSDDAEITIDVDAIGNGTATGLKITLIGTR